MPACMRYEVSPRWQGIIPEGEVSFIGGEFRSNLHHGKNFDVVSRTLYPTLRMSFSPIAFVELFSPPFRLIVPRSKQAEQTV